jgi:hypothetical protein
VRVTKEDFDKLPKNKQKEYREEIDKLNLTSPFYFLLNNTNSLCLLFMGAMAVLFLGVPLYYLAFGFESLSILLALSKYTVYVCILTFVIFFIIFLGLSMRNIKRANKVQDKYFKVEIK